MPDPIQVLTLLARLFDEQAGPGGDHPDFYRGATHACRVALQIIAPPPIEKAKGRGPGGRGKGRKGREEEEEEAAGDSGKVSGNRMMVAAAVGGGKSRERPAVAQMAHVCPECGKVYELPQHLGMHRKREHGVASARERAGRGAEQQPPAPSDNSSGVVSGVNTRDALRERLAQGPINVRELAGELGKTEKQLRDAISGLRHEGVLITALGDQRYETAS